MAELTKQRIIEYLKASTQNSSGMFEIGEETICALMSLLTNAAPQLTQQALVVPDELANKSFEYIANKFQVSISDAQWVLVGWNACRDAMLQCSEPETDNTNQQFESLAKSK